MSKATTMGRLVVRGEEECPSVMMHEDVVCNRSIDASSTVWSSRYHGEPYFFCSLRCREQFELEPEQFLPPSEHTPVPPSALLRLVS